MPTLVKKETSVRSTVSVGVVSPMHRLRASLSLWALISSMDPPTKSVLETVSKLSDSGSNCTHKR